MLADQPTLSRNIISLAEARRVREAHAAQPLRARICCHCGAALGEGEREDECSGAGFTAASMPVLRAAE